MTELLVSVRSPREAEAALAGGAHLIDIKEPARGSLGRAETEIRDAVSRTVAGRRPLSAAMGELLEAPVPTSLAGVSYVKWGLAGCAAVSQWRERLRAVVGAITQIAPGCHGVAVAYADWQRAAAPPPGEVADFAVGDRMKVFLLDTWCKDGTTLLDQLTLPTILDLGRRCRRAGVRVAFAGSIDLPQMVELRQVEPDWFAVRGAACRSGRRDGEIESSRVRRLVEAL